jgi:hypothetical protein
MCFIIRFLRIFITTKHFIYLNLTLEVNILKVFIVTIMVLFIIVAKNFIIATTSIIP